MWKSVEGSAEIAQTVIGVAQAAQSTASGATETQASAQELSRMAAELQQLVGQFKVAETGTRVTRGTTSKKGGHAQIGVRPYTNGHDAEVRI